jgi:hypothetical protein
LAVDGDPAVLAAVARDERGFILAGPDVRAKRRRGAGARPSRIQHRQHGRDPDDNGAKQQRDQVGRRGGVLRQRAGADRAERLAASESRAGNERRRTAIGSEVEQRRTGR